MRICGHVCGRGFGPSSAFEKGKFGAIATFTQRSRNRHWEAKIRRKGRRLTKTFRTKELAEQWARLTEAAIMDGRCTDVRAAEKITFAKVIDNYIEKEAPQHKGAAAEIQRLRKFIKDEKRTAQLAMADMRTEDFEDCCDRRLRAVKSAAATKRELAMRQAVVERTYRNLVLRCGFYEGCSSGPIT